VKVELQDSFVDKHLDLNELSAINNSTRPDTSMNTTSQEILNKLSIIQKSGGSNEINNNFDT
jgi:hypothetical protein